MSIPRVRSSRRIAGAGAAFLVVTLLGGATWYDLAASAPVAEAPQVTTSAPLAQTAIPGGRTSYADVVKVVTPAVVTIQVEGRARMAPTVNTAVTPIQA